MKKIIALSLTLILLLSVAACSVSDPIIPTAKATPAERAEAGLTKQHVNLLTLLCQPALQKFAQKGGGGNAAHHQRLMHPSLFACA